MVPFAGERFIYFAGHRSGSTTSWATPGRSPDEPKMGDAERCSVVQVIPAGAPEWYTCWCWASWENRTPVLPYDATSLLPCEWVCGFSNHCCCFRRCRVTYGNDWCWCAKSCLHGKLKSHCSVLLRQTQ